MKVLPFALLMSALASPPAFSQTDAEKDAAISPRVDEYIHAEIQREKIPGLALAVLRDGQIIKVQGYGLSNVELDVPVKPETIFQTGSVGKQFTATAVMMLAEQGKLGLDEKIAKYLPEAPATWKDITIRNLLNHTSGIPDYGSDEDNAAKEAINLRADYTEDELVRRFAALPLDFPPGSKWSYSNSGYVTLGVIIHKVSGMFYGDFLEQHIFQPLHMTATHIISEANIVSNRSSGYRLDHGELKNQQWVSPTLNTTADGALYTNVLDMAKWDAALGQQTLLKKSSYEEMYTPVHLSDGKTYGYGFGWGLTAVNGHPLIEHNGAWQGFTTDIARFVGEHDKLSVVVLTNLDGAKTVTIAHAVAALYRPALQVSDRNKVAD
jgi:CubicO group peptidase (beta-lactamase class C family)